MRTINRIYNFFLKLKFRFAPKKVIFSGKKTNYDLSLAKTQWGYFEKIINRWTSPDCVHLEGNKIYITALTVKNIVEVNGERVYCLFKRGWAHFPGLDYSKAYGTWEIKFRYESGCRPAVWMLRENYAHPKTTIEVTGIHVSDSLIEFDDLPLYVQLNWYVYHESNSLGRISFIFGNFIKVNNDLINLPPGKLKFTISKDNITPEVDILEVIDGMYTQTIHHGFSLEKYEKHAFGSKVCKEKKGEMIELTVAVTISTKGYKFFIDGVLSCEVWEGMSPEPVYLIFSNTLDNTEKSGLFYMIVDEVNYYEPIKN